jgi:sugar/nucleoside kinase (ribokinase family)
MADLRLPASAPFDVVGFGFNTYDHVCLVARAPAFDAKQRLIEYRLQPGGQVPTALVALQRWGLRTAYVGPFGDDAGGRLQRASLEAEGVDVRATRLRSGVASQTSVILVDAASGSREVLWQRPDGLALGADELDRDALVGGKILLMDADDIDTAIIAARWAKNAGVVVVLDVDVPGPRTLELLRFSDVAIVTDGFPQELAGTPSLRDALLRMADMGPTIVAATCGGRGAVAYARRARSGRAEDRGGWYDVEAFPVQAVDTTSAGDLFHAGFIFGLLREWQLPAIWRFAAAAAALECTQLGGRAAIPSLAAALALARPSPE